MHPKQAFEEYFKFRRTTCFNKEKQPAKERKDWLSHDKRYRITWRRVVLGVHVPARYYALKKLWVSHPDGGWPIWDFVKDRRPYRTLYAAVKACMQSEKIEIEAQLAPKRRQRKKTESTKTRTPLPVEQPKKRGRPKGSKNKKPRVDKGR